MERETESDRERQKWCIPGDPQSVQLGKATTTMIRIKTTLFVVKLGE